MPISDPFKGFHTGLNSPVEGGFDITPDDATDLPTVTRAMMVTSAGTVTAQMLSGETIALPGLTPGVIYPFRVVRVLASGTTATGLKGLV